MYKRQEHDTDNNNSCVITITGNNQRALLAGDIDHTVETQLLQNGKIVNSNVVVVPHHGSQTSSSKAFVSKLKPEYAVFSAGYLNRFRHPNLDVVGRYRDAGSAIVKTDECGAWQFVDGQASCYRSQVLPRWKRILRQDRVSRQ